MFGALIVKITELEALIADLQAELAQERANVQQLTVLNEEQIIENQILIELIQKLETEATENGETITVQHTQIVEQVKVIENLTTEIEELVVIINEQGENIIEMQEIIVELETLIETMIEENFVPTLEDPMDFDFMQEAFIFAGRVFTYDPTDVANGSNAISVRRVFTSESNGRIFVVIDNNGVLINATGAQTQQDQLGNFSRLEVSGIEQTFIATVYTIDIEVEIEEYDWASLDINNTDSFEAIGKTFNHESTSSYGGGNFTLVRYSTPNGDILLHTKKTGFSPYSHIRYYAAGTAASDYVEVYSN